MAPSGALFWSSGMYHFLNDGYEEGKGVLKCAGCGEEYTRVKGVYWFRRGEDRSSCDTGFLTLSGHQDSVKTSNEFNPSARRDGLRVIYSCEHCSTLSSLNIAQHKGSTYINAESVSSSILEHIYFGKDHD
jgi:hypothetical protein